MRMNLKTMASLAMVTSLPMLASAALTVTVDGIGGDSTHFTKLSDAVAYVNANSSEPNVINITTGSLVDNAQMIISSPMTINGDGSGTSSTCDIKVGVAAIKAAADIGNTNGKAYIEIATVGNVTINDLQIHPDARGGTGTSLVDPIDFYKPDGGVGEYVLNRVKISASTAAGTYEPLDQDKDIYNTDSFIWYGYQENHGIYAINNIGGTGSYNTTLNDCQGGACRSTAVFIANQSGTTTINGGLFGHAGEDAIRVKGATGVSIVGTADDRVRLVYANRSSGGEFLRVNGGAVLPLVKYVDAVKGPIGDLTVAPPTATGFLVQDGTITSMQFCRSSGVWSYGLHVVTGAATVSDCTFYASGTPSTFGKPSNDPGHDPVKVEGGTVSINDTIFASQRDGALQLSGGTVSLLNCAIPTDGYTTESLNATTPIVGSPTNVGALTDSPHFVTSTYDFASPSNSSFLRPSTVSYNTAHTGGTQLFGGAGPAPAAVNDWAMY